MKNSRRKLQGILGAGDFPAEVLTGIPVIEIKGDSEATVIRHRGILSYEENEMQIATSLGTVTVRGSNLMVFRMNRERIQLRGSVRSVRIGEDAE